MLPILERIGAALPFAAFLRRLAVGQRSRLDSPRLSPAPPFAQDGPVDGELDLYRQQHRDLLGLAARLAERADRATLQTADGAGEAHRLLHDLSGKLMVHLKMEDRSLYPALLRSADPSVRAGARRFQDEMGTLWPTAEAFFRHWLRPDSILHAPDAFAAELRPLLHALAARIAAEDAELFPRADRAGG